MNRLPEQLVAWHNRHPLALRITVNDVHTVGVVALPFMRSGSKTAAAPAAVPLATRMIEPVLDEPVATESAPAEQPVRGVDAALAPGAEAQPASTPSPAIAPPAAPPPRWKFWLRAGDKAVGLNQTWPVFSEPFVDGLSASRISGFTQAHGFATRPGQAAWPTREVMIDDSLVASPKAGYGAWPLELYVISAAIDASNKRRTRVLIGQGASDDSVTVLGRRCLSPVRVSGLGLALLLLVGGASAALWWPQRESAHEAAAVAAEPAASAASAAAEPASASSAASAVSAAAPMAEEASAPEAASSASSAPLAASESTPAPDAEAASEPTRDIRPRLVERVYPRRGKQPTRSLLAPAETAPVAASKPLENVAGPKPEKPAGKSMPGSNNNNNSDGRPVVALVGPPSANKADAEALLERLRGAVEGVQGKSNTALQATVFQTPEGWRAAVWPFASREEAQLINATLVARGMRTRAVDF